MGTVASELMAIATTARGHDGAMVVRIVESQRGRHLIGTDPARVDGETVDGWISRVVPGSRAFVREPATPDRATAPCDGDVHDGYERFGDHALTETRAVDDP